MGYRRVPFKIAVKRIILIKTWCFDTRKLHIPISLDFFFYFLESHLWVKISQVRALEKKVDRRTTFAYVVFCLRRRHTKNLRRNVRQSFLTTCSVWFHLSFLTYRCRWSLYYSAFYRSSGSRRSRRASWLPTLPCPGWWSWTPMRPSALFTMIAGSSREWCSVRIPGRFDKFPATSSRILKRPVRLRETKEK